MKSLDIDGPLHKVSFFLVPTIPLVTQQSTYIIQNSNLKVYPIHGGLSMGSMDERKWSDKFFHF
jgi:hypothetical protein